MQRWTLEQFQNTNQIYHVRNYSRCVNRTDARDNYYSEEADKKATAALADQLSSARVELAIFRVSGERINQLSHEDYHGVHHVVIPGKSASAVLIPLTPQTRRKVKASASFIQANPPFHVPATCRNHGQEDKAWKDSSW